MRLHNGGHGANAGDDGHIVGANPLHAIGQQKGGHHRGHNGQQNAVGKKVGVQERSGRALGKKEMQEYTQRGREHGISRKLVGADPRNDLAAARNVDGVGDGANEHAKAAPQKPLGTRVDPDFADKSNPDADIGEQQGKPLVFENGLAKEEKIDEHRKGGIEKKDQPFQAGGDVLQADEIKQAAKVITKNAEQKREQPLAACQRYIGALPADEKSRQQIKRQRKNHAQREQGHGINTGGKKRLLHKNGFRGKQDGAEQGNEKAGCRQACLWRCFSHGKKKTTNT